MSAYTRFSENSGGLRVMSRLEVWTWLKGLPNEDLFLLLGDNRKRLRRIWGPHTCTFTGEYRHWIWMRGDPPTWCALTGRAGMSVEISKGLPAEQALKIMQELLELLKKDVEEHAEGVST